MNGRTTDINADNWTMYFLLLKQTFIWNERVMLSGWDSQSKRTNINLRSSLRMLTNIGKGRRTVNVSGFPFLLPVRMTFYLFFTARNEVGSRLSFYTCLSVHRGGVCSRGSPGPHPGESPGPRWGVSRPMSGGCIPAYTEAATPPPPDGYCCGWYASYWNAFLFIYLFIVMLK